MIHLYSCFCDILRFPEVFFFFLFSTGSKARVCASDWHRPLSSRRCFATLSLFLFPSILTSDELVDALPVHELLSLKPQLELPQRPLWWITGMNHVPGNGRHVINVNFMSPIWSACDICTECYVCYHLLTCRLKSPLTVPAWASAGFVCPTILRDDWITWWPSHAYRNTKHWRPLYSNTDYLVQTAVQGRKAGTLLRSHQQQAEPAGSKTNRKQTQINRSVIFSLNVTAVLSVFSLIFIFSELQDIDPQIFTKQILPRHNFCDPNVAL